MNEWDVDGDFSKPSESQEDKEKRLQFDKDVFLTFEPECGKRVLEYFQSNTIKTPNWVPGHPENYAIYREGQNSIVREILHRIDNAKKG
jgi:hypothetical protein